MTKNSDFKKLVRDRMKKTGESYTTARRHLEERETPRHGPTLEGWDITGPNDHLPDFEVTDYEGGLEPDMRHRGKPCAYLRSVVEEPESHVVIMQLVDSGKYHGKRIRFSADIRCDAETEDAGLWLRVVPVGKKTSFAWGQDQATTDWRRGEIVVDVDPRSASVMFGVSLEGRGKVWMSDARFEIVDESVPLTGRTWHDWHPPEPVNLSFEG